MRLLVIQHQITGFFFVMELWGLFGILLVINISTGLHIQTVVVFGRPGSGKSTIAAVALSKTFNSCMGIDLDVCISREMKDNFLQGIYPNSDQRVAFMQSACDYIENSISCACKDKASLKICLISFSFVNDDLRKVFRGKFPKSKWVLINTSQEMAESRILQRSGHFYKGTPKEDYRIKNEQSQWEFAPVDFDHVDLNGHDDIETNANRLIAIIRTAEIQHSEE